MCSVRCVASDFDGRVDGARYIVYDFVDDTANEAHVSLTPSASRPKRKLPNELNLACERVITLPEKSSRSLLWHTSIQKELYYQLNSILCSEDTDLLLSTLRPSLLVPPYLARRHHVRYRILIEGNISNEVDTISSLPFASMVSDLVSIWNIRTAERCYAVNRDVKEWVSSLPFSKPQIEILPHGVDVPSYFVNQDSQLNPPLNTHLYCVM